MIFKDKNMVMDILILELSVVFLEVPFKRVTATAARKMSPDQIF